MMGLFGGAFDPPHLGHVALLARASEHFALERLVVLVVAEPGHKRVHAEPAKRLELARAAFPDAEVELDPHARTVDMLRVGRFFDPLLLIGAAVSSLLFGASHVVSAPWRDVVFLQTLMVFTGIGLASIYERRANLVADIAAHVAFNVIGIVIIFSTR